MEWTKETPSYWDDDKKDIIGGAAPGTFKTQSFEDGEMLPGEWWRVQDQGKTLGYGWMDITWGDAEVLLAVRSDQQSRGVGSFIMDHLENEARNHGLNYMYNQVNSAHPDYVGVTQWLEKRNFKESSDGLLKRSIAPKP